MNHFSLDDPNEQEEKTYYQFEDDPSTHDTSDAVISTETGTRRQFLYGYLAGVATMSTTAALSLGYLEGLLNQKKYDELKIRGSLLQRMRTMIMDDFHDIPGDESKLIPKELQTRISHFNHMAIQYTIEIEKLKKRVGNQVVQNLEDIDSIHLPKPARLILKKPGRKPIEFDILRPGKTSDVQPIQ